MRTLAVRTIIALLAAGALSSAAAAENPITFIENELKAGKKIIVVPPGVYRLTPKNGVYLTLRDLSGVTIDFTGVEFLGLVNTRMLEIENCVDVTLKGLTIDYDPLPFTQARIVEVDDQKNWTVEVIEGYPSEDARGGWPIQVYGRESLELVNPMRFEDNAAAIRTGERVYRITGGKNRSGALGDIVVFSCNNSRDKNGKRETGKDYAVFSRDCVNLRLEGFTVYSARSMAFREDGNTKAVYLNCKVARRPPETDHVQRGLKRLRSGNHDAFHSRFAKVGPQIIGCYAHYHCDDCVNITGLYSIVVKADGDELRIIAVEDGRYLPVAGDSIQIMTPRFGRRLPDAEVLSVTPDGGTTVADEALLRTLSLWPGSYRWYSTAFIMRIDRAEPLEMGSVIIDSRCGSGFLVKDCDFGHTRARGILFKGSDGIVENNTVVDCSGPGIWAGPSYAWMEGPCCSNVKVIGNRFRGCGGAGIVITGKTGLKIDLPANGHRDIVVSGNTITGTTRGIQVTGCTNLDISNNVLELRTKRPEGAIILENVVNVTQENNVVSTRETKPE